MQFTKKPLSVTDQIAQLEARGMQILDKEKAAHYLSNVSYYRLSAYWYTFLRNPKAEHRFAAATSFGQVIDTYVFDRKLRLLIFDELERIEIALRTRITYSFCHRFGNNWYEQKKLFRNPEYFYKFQTLMLDEMNRTSEVFIRHYRTKYDDPPNPPAWMVLELASFGQLSMLYKNLRNNEPRKQIADHFGLHENVLESWLESLSFVRNVCAHHMRLWNRKIPKQPILPLHSDYPFLAQLPPAPQQNRIYVILSAIRYLLGRVFPTTFFTARLTALLQEYPDLPLHYMGFTAHWQDEQLWMG